MNRFKHLRPVTMLDGNLAAGEPAWAVTLKDGLLAWPLAGGRRIAGGMSASPQTNSNGQAVLSALPHVEIYTDGGRKPNPGLAVMGSCYDWVKGHARNRENEHCDQLSHAARHLANLPADEACENQDGAGEQRGF